MLRILMCGVLVITAGCADQGTNAPPLLAGQERSESGSVVARATRPQEAGSTVVLKPRANNDRNQPIKDPIATGLRGQPIFKNALKSIAFSPDGTLLATGNGEGVVQLWDVKKRKRISLITAHTSWVFDVEFDSTGRRLVTAGGDNLVELWDVASRRMKKVLKGHSDDVHAALFTPDGQQIVSGSDDTSVMLWDVKTGQGKKLGNHRKQVTAVAVSRDGKRAASASRDSTIQLWELPSGKSMGELKGHSADVLSVSFSPDGKQLASASYDKTVRLWNIETRKTSLILKGHQDWAFCAVLTTDGKQLVSGAGDQLLRLWSVADGSLLHSLKFKSDLADVALSSDGRTGAVATAGGTAELFEIKENRLEHKSTLVIEKPVNKQKQPGASQAFAPQIYVDLHATAIDTNHPEWSNSVAAIGEIGDGYSLQLLGELDKEGLSAPEQELLERTIATINKRVEKREPADLVNAIQPRFERAALSDLSCNVLEGIIVKWTMKSIEPQLDNPLVRAELKRIRDTYEPAVEIETMFASLQPRVREYAARLLADEKPQAKK